MIASDQADLLSLDLVVSVKIRLVDRECHVEPTTVLCSVHAAYTAETEQVVQKIALSRSNVCFSAYPSDILAANTISTAEMHVGSQAISIAGSGKNVGQASQNVGSSTDVAILPNRRVPHDQNAIKALGYDDSDAYAVAEHIASDDKMVTTAVHAVRVGANAPRTSGITQCVGRTSLVAKLSIPKSSCSNAEIIIQAYCCLPNHRDETCFHRCGFAIVSVANLAQGVQNAVLFDNARWSALEWRNVDMDDSQQDATPSTRSNRGNCIVALSSATKNVLSALPVRRIVSIDKSTAKCVEIITQRDAVRHALALDFRICNSCINPRILPNFAFNGSVVPSCIFTDVCNNISSLRDRITEPYNAPTIGPLPFSPKQEWYLTCLDNVLDRRASWMLPALWNGNRKQAILETLTTMVRNGTDTTRAMILIDIATITPSGFPYLYDYMLSFDDWSMSDGGATLRQSDEFTRCLAYLHSGDCEDDAVLAVMIVESLCHEVLAGRITSSDLMFVASARATHALAVSLKMVQCASAESADEEHRPAAHACVDLIPLSLLSNALYTGSQMVELTRKDGAPEAVKDACKVALDKYLTVADLPATTDWRMALLKILPGQQHNDKHIVVVGEGTGVVSMIRPNMGEALDSYTRMYVKEVFVGATQGCKIGSREEFTHAHESVFYLFTMSVLLSDSDLQKMGLCEMVFITSDEECGGCGAWGHSESKQVRYHRNSVAYGVPHDIYVLMDGLVGALPIPETTLLTRSRTEESYLRTVLSRDVPLTSVDDPGHNGVSSEFKAAVSSFESILNDIDSIPRSSKRASRAITQPLAAMWGAKDTSVALVICQLQYLEPGIVTIMKKRIAEARAIIDCTHTIQIVAPGLAVAVFRVLVSNHLVPKQ